MHLASIGIENYRAIRKVWLTLDSTTLLIGENEIGKSSLLEALIMVLDADIKASKFTFSRRHFHKIEGIAVGPIDIQLHFKEKHVNEWEEDSYEILHRVIPTSNKIPRQLTLRVQALLNQNDSVQVVWSLKIPGIADPIENMEVVEWIRKFKTVIHVPAGMLTGHGIENVRLNNKEYSRKEAPAEVLQLIDQIEDSSFKLLTGNSTSNIREIGLGYKASRKLIEYLREGRMKRFALRVDQMLDSHDEQDAQLAKVPNTRIGAQRLGVLLLVAAWLRASPDIFEIDIDPIWILEDPEAHLHPMTLTSVGHLFGAIRWQKVVTTYSGELVSTVPIEKLRRLTRKNGILTQHLVDSKSLTPDDRRRIGYHLGARNSNVWFDRLWLLVEGESEYWIMPQMAKILGHDFGLEGIGCVEFAQSGLSSVIKLADQLGIFWHILTDGDEAGKNYTQTALGFLDGRNDKEHITQFIESDIEHCFWNNGYHDFYRNYAKVPENKSDAKSAWIIKRAIKKHSKPFLSVAIAQVVQQTGSNGVPEILANVIHKCVKAARAGTEN